MHYAAIEFHIGAEMDFFFAARRTVMNCKASVMHNVAIELQIGPEIAIFNFFLAKTDIILVLNLTRNSPSHHRRFR